LRTEEEAKFELDEQILELYDRGISIGDISDCLKTPTEYVNFLHSNVPVEYIA